jgi:hypothetical protein
MTSLVGHAGPPEALKPSPAFVDPDEVSSHVLTRPFGAASEMGYGRQV